MKKVTKYFCLIVVLCLILGTIIVFPIFQSGYKMYKSAVITNRLSDVVDKIRTNDNYVQLDDIAPEFIHQLILSEDKRFYYHNGFDIFATTRAMINNIRLGYFAQGGSTITQQLAKNLYFSFEKKFERKIAELLVAIDIEREYTKDEILEIYINIIYFGKGCYGISEATEYYYNVCPEDITVEQCSALVYTIKCPNYYNPEVLNSVA